MIFNQFIKRRESSFASSCMDKCASVMRGYWFCSFGAPNFRNIAAQSVLVKSVCSAVRAEAEAQAARRENCYQSGSREGRERERDDGVEFIDLIVVFISLSGARGFLTW